MRKRLLSASLAAALVLSMTCAAAPISASADAADYGLADKTADGVILHCFDWSFDTIRENLPEIAAAGYTTIQTSPVQQPKDYGDWTNGEGQWWKLYQPLSFSIADKSWLGTKTELKALCDEADKYGIKIICDIVSNHMANLTDDLYKTYAPAIEQYEPELYANTDQYFHQLAKEPDDYKLQYIVQGSLSKLPDLNTGDEFVQGRVISLLKECIDCGVDGFRFDAAKHIETPADGEYASNFWPNVIGSAEEYAKEKGTDIFCYGEILTTPGQGRSILDYTKYLNVTDNQAGDATLYHVVNKHPDRIPKAQGYTFKDDDPSHYVLWAESHDTYMGKSGSAISNTAKVSNEDIAKAWAIVAARGKSQSLYFARPNDIIGLAGDTSWKSTVVSEVNKFHNKFIGTDDAVFSEGDAAAVQRGDSGIVIVNLGDSSDISMTTQGMKDGTYTDAVTGNTFTVSGGKISGTVGSSGVAVVYEGAVTTPKILFSEENASFKSSTYKLTLTLENAESGTYSIDGGAPVTFTGETTIVLGEGVEEGKTITVKATATNGAKTVEAEHSYYKEIVDHSGVIVYFSNDKKNYKSVYIYAFYDDVDDKGEKVNIANNGSWPGVTMNFDDEKNLYYYEVPSDIPVGKGCVIFNDGNGQQTKDLFIKDNISIYSDTRNRLLPYNPDGVTLIYGDMNSDGKIDASDALDILRASLETSALDEKTIKTIDVDENGKVDSNDALLVLRKSVDLSDTGRTGEEFVYTGEVQTPTETDTDTAAKPAQPVSGSTFYVFNRCGWLFNDGCKMWIVNNDTGEALETTKSEPESDNAEYSYVTLPDGWKSISLHRTQWNMTIEESANDPAHSVWNCGEIPEGKNAVHVRDSGDSGIKYKTYTP